MSSILKEELELEELRRRAGLPPRTDYIRSLKEASLPPASAQKTYWHGTDNLAGAKIARMGYLKTAFEVERKNGGTMALTAQNGVYMTPEFTEALKYASPKRKTAWSWIFAIPGTGVTEMSIDEDELGQLAHVLVNGVHRFKMNDQYMSKFKGYYRAAKDPKVAGPFLELIKHNFPQFMEELEGQAPTSSIIKAGQQLVSAVPDDLKQALTLHGCHIVALHPITVTMAWRFKPNLNGKIHNAYIFGNDPGKALNEFAERIK